MQALWRLLCRPAALVSGRNIALHDRPLVRVFFAKLTERGHRSQPLANLLGIIIR